jgi:hypothetical protein
MILPSASYSAMKQPRLIATHQTGTPSGRHPHIHTDALCHLFIRSEYSNSVGVLLRVAQNQRFCGKITSDFSHYVKLI